MKKIIIFDFDGTLADTFPPMVKILKKQVKEMGYGELTSRQIDVMREMKPLDIIKHFKFPIWKVPSLIKDIREGLFKQIAQVKLFQGIDNVVLDLKRKGFTLGILTSNSVKAVEIFLNEHNLECFDFVESETKIFKKSKHLIKIIKKYSFNKNEVIYIGDEVRDIIASQETGIDVIAVTWGYNRRDVLKQNHPTYLVDKPNDIINMLLNI